MVYSKIIKIRELPPVRTAPYVDNNNNKPPSILEMKTNSKDHNYEIRYRNNFIMTYYECFCEHGNAVFSPADIWLAVCLSYSKYANSDTEQIGKYITKDFSGDKTVLTSYFDPTEEPDYTELTEDIIEQTLGSIHDKNLSDTLRNDFECSTRTEKIACGIATMKVCEKFFEYRFMTYCGFNHIKLLGSVDDWTKLSSKVHDMAQYGDKKWKNYITNVEQIVEKFVQVIKDEDTWPYISFFESMIDSGYEEGFYGDRADTISGWILKLFYGFTDKYIVSEVPIIKASTTVKRIDGDKEEMLNIESGFCNISMTLDKHESNRTNLQYIDTGLLEEQEDKPKTESENESKSESDNKSNNESIKEQDYRTKYKFEYVDTLQNIYDYRPVTYYMVSTMTK
jgi:hypothetical protein